MNHARFSQPNLQPLMKPQTAVLIGCILSLSSALSQAANVTQNFETQPGAAASWPGWTTGPGGSAQISTQQSASGDQALKFTATSVTALSHACDSTGGGYSLS